MRRFIIEQCLQSEFSLIEKPTSVEELENADEVFLTNSIRGVRWVKEFRGKTYINQKVKEIHTFIQKQLL